MTEHLFARLSDVQALQPLDADLTTIAGLTATSDNFIQAKASAWASRTVAQVKVDLGLAGINSGDQTSIVGITGTKAQFDAAVTDGNILYVGDITQYTDELAQDAIGAMLDASLVYVDATPLLQRAALTGDVTASAGSNTTAIAAGVIVNADINAAAAIDATKIADGSVTSAEFQFINTLSSNVQTQIDGKQPLDSDLTTIAGLTATTDNFIQSKASAWASQTPAQVKVDLNLTGTNSGDQTSIVGITGTKAQFDTAVTDGNFSYVGNALTADHGGGNWKVFHTNGSGGITELALGGAGTFLRSNGAASVPDFATPSGSGDVVGPASSTDNALARFDLTTGKLLQNSVVTLNDNGEMIFPAGGVADAPIKFTTGTNLTTAENGALEFDGNSFYLTTDDGNRGVILIEHFIRQSLSRTLTSSTAEQKLFDSVTNGTLTLENGTYFFECLFSLSGMSATSGNAAFDILGAGTAVLADVLYHVVGVDGNINTAATQTGSTANQGQTPASAVVAGTGTAMQARISGTFEVTTAGTLIPSVTLVTAAAATVAAGTYFRCRRVGTIGVVSVGQWT